MPIRPRWVTSAMPASSKNHLLATSWLKRRTRLWSPRRALAVRFCRSSADDFSRCGEGGINRNILDAAVAHVCAIRLAGTRAGPISRRFQRSGERIERAPEARVGGAEEADRWGPQ